MRSTIVVAGVTAAIVLGSDRVTAQEPRPAPLALADAIAYARQNDSRIREAAYAVEQANVTRRIADSAFRPRIVPNVLGAIGQPDISSQTYGVSLSQRFTNGTQLDANVGTSASRNQLGTFYYTDTTFLLTQPIVGGPGRDWVRRELATAERQVDNLSAQRRLTEQRVIVDVATAYYAIVARRQVVAVAEKARERVARVLDISKAKLTIGKVSQLDVLRAEQLVREADSQLLDARSAAEDAHDQLSLLMGRPANATFDVDPDIPVAEERIGADEAVRIALERRPDLQSARRTAIEMEHAAAAVHRFGLPEFDMKLALTRREAAPNLGSSFGLDRFRLVPFASLSMPASRAGEHETALIQEQRARGDLDRLQAQIEIEVRRLVRQQERLVHAKSSSEAAVDFAKKEVDVAAERFNRGLSNNLDLVSAETDLLTAESRRIDVLAALAVAKLNLQAALGILDGPSQ